MLRLSEPLDRLRPAGTPGGPDESEPQHRHDEQQREIAGVAIHEATRRHLRATER